MISGLLGSIRYHFPWSKWCRPTWSSGTPCCVSVSLTHRLNLLSRGNSPPSRDVLRQFPPQTDWRFHSPPCLNIFTPYLTNFSNINMCLINIFQILLHHIHYIFSHCCAPLQNVERNNAVQNPRGFLERIFALCRHSPGIESKLLGKLYTKG